MQNQNQGQRVIQNLFNRLQEVCPETHSFTANRADPTLVTQGRTKEAVEISGKYYTINWVASWGLEVDVWCADSEYERPQKIIGVYEDEGYLSKREWKNGDLILIRNIVKELEKKSKKSFLL